ncbi:hypothetical protein NN561_017994 [Cricetulus griseus]
MQTLPVQKAARPPSQTPAPGSQQQAPSLPSATLLSPLAQDVQSSPAHPRYPPAAAPEVTAQTSAQQHGVRPAPPPPLTSPCTAELCARLARLARPRLPPADDRDSPSSDSKLSRRPGNDNNG